ncbi:hypothetical protein, partial [Rhizobium ruizarguesonis]|uniref:hypothetical protein n=1 Tax=Rhizobium ruizarguesonis TaxID=2081791 RepID=UPI001CF5AA57
MSWQVGEDFSAVEADAVRIDIDHQASEAWPPASRCAAITESSISGGGGFVGERRLGAPRDRSRGQDAALLGHPGCD